MRNILVVGGAGYIGSHTVKLLNKAGYKVVVFDNLCSGHKEAVLGSKLVIGELKDKELLSRVIKKNRIEAVLHFAAFSDVAESVENPQKYLKNNCFDGLNLLEAMLENHVDKIIFSSSAAVYGEQNKMPVTEDMALNPASPYGFSKMMFEKALRNFSKKGLKYISLRYFNAAGADIEGVLGMDKKRKTHLIISAILTALKQREKLYLFGSDYQTKDGTCVRDYIHVMDLASAHISALKYLSENNQSEIINLGSGKGYTNREVIEMVKKVSSTDFKIETVTRRSGDLAKIIASSKKAQKLLKWKCKYSDLETIIQTAYDWQKTHPRGYKSLLKSKHCNKLHIK